MLKICKNRLSVGDRAPVCLRRLRVLPPDPALLLPPTITTLLSSYQAINAFYYPIKGKNSWRNVLHLLLLHFCTYFSLCSFCWLGEQEYFLPQGAGYPSYVIGLIPWKVKHNLSIMWPSKSQIAKHNRAWFWNFICLE